MTLWRLLYNVIMYQSGSSYQVQVDIQHEHDDILSVMVTWETRLQRQNARPHWLDYKVTVLFELLVTMQ